MKRITRILLITLCLLSLLSFEVLAADERLVDEADLLSSSGYSDVEDALNKVSRRHDVDIVIVTVDSTDGEDLEDFADDWFDYGDYRPDGILLLVSMEDRDWYVSTTGYGITAVTDAGLKYMSSQFVPYLSDGDYEDAFLAFIDLCDSFLNQAETGDPYDTHNLPKEPFRFTLNLVICLGIGLIVALIATGSMKRQLVAARQQTADDYVAPGSLQLTASHDLFLYSNITRQERPQSGGSSTHTSSSGTTHGGGGGKF